MKEIQEELVLARVSARFELAEGNELSGGDCI